MSLNFSSLEDVYGCKYSELSRNNKKDNNSLELDMVNETNNQLKEMESGIEQFANYQGPNSIDSGMAQIISEESFAKKKTKKSKKLKKNNKKRNPPPPPPPPPPVMNNMESSSEDESDSDAESEPASAPINKRMLNNENIQLKKQMNELDTKLNLLINNLNKEKGENNKVNNRTETNNIYDIILFVIFGLFVLLLLESLTKLISKNIVKYEPSNAIKGVME